jgi:hypothetical protein
MGKHTEYWRQYGKSQTRGALRIAATVAGWLLIIVFVVLVGDATGPLFPVLVGAAFVGLVVSLVVLGKDAYKVVCPECGTRYRRSKWFGQCPSCGLKLLQEDP